MSAPLRGSTQRFRWPEGALALLLVLAVGALYAQTARHQFVSFDDGSYLTENPHVTGGLTAANVRWAFLAFHSANWHPLTWLSHQLDVTLFGLAPGPHHLVSAGLHALNAVLLFVFFRRASGRLGPSVLVALLFALHPLRAESVAWAAERKDVLSGAFFALTLLAYERHARAPSRASLVRVGLLCALGLLAKPMLVTLPALLLVLDFWPLNRAARGEDGVASERAPRALVLEKLPLAGLALLSALVTLVAQQAAGAVQSIESLTLVERLATALTAVLAYLGQTLWPARLAFFQPHPALIERAAFAPLGPRTWLALLLLIGVTLLAWRLRRRLPMLLAGWAWFGLMLLPVAGLVQVGSQLHADRYTYLPMIGPVFALVFALDAVLAPRLRRPAFALGLLVAGLLGALAWRQIATWKDSRTLCEQALRATDRNYVAHEHLGLWYQGHGELEPAVEHYRAALAILPNLPSAHSNLATIHEVQGRRDEALAEFAEALRLDPVFLKARLSLGLLFEREGDLARAAEHYAQATREHPSSADAWTKLGDMRLALGRPAEARTAYLEARAQGRDSAELEVALGRAADETGDAHAALAHYLAAERRVPGHPGAVHGRAWIRATRADPALRDPERALAELAGCATRGEPSNWMHQRVLAAAQAALGRFVEAARTAAEASALAPRTEWERLAAERARYTAGEALVR